MTKMSWLLSLAIAGVCVGGCNEDPTNAPTLEDAQAAQANRMKAIDDNPNLTAEQKAMMKSRLGSVGTGSAKPGQAPNVK